MDDATRAINFDGHAPASKQPYYNAIFNNGEMSRDLSVLSLPVYDELSARVEVVLSYLLAALARTEGERDILKEAGKTLQRIEFILGGWSGVTEDCDEAALRTNANRALELLREKLPPIVAGLTREERG